jgi:hypothetical protein
VNVRQADLVVRIRDVHRDGARVEFIAMGRGLALGPATLDDGTAIRIGDLINLGGGVFQVVGSVVEAT